MKIECTSEEFIGILERFNDKNHEKIMAIAEDYLNKVIDARNLTTEERNRQLMVNALNGLDDLEYMCKMTDGSHDVHVYLNDIPVEFEAVNVDYDFDGSLKIFIKDEGLTYKEKSHDI